jgi:hypothetical protein
VSEERADYGGDQGRRVLHEALVVEAARALVAHHDARLGVPMDAVGRAAWGSEGERRLAALCEAVRRLEGTE